MRIPLVFLFLLITIAATVSTAAQCTQKLNDLPPAPELLGFRLGMTKNEIKARVPQTRFGHTDEFGVSKTTINPYFDESIDKSNLESVRSISLDLLDDHLTSLWIGYDETYKIQSVEEFIKTISASLKLTGSWSAARSKGQQLKCADFEVFVSTVARAPSLRIVDVAAEEAIAERRQAKEEHDSAAAEATATATEETAEIVGDKKAKVYYLATCQTTIEIPAANKVLFTSSEEAEKAGFKLAKGCH
ncbi:MAG TPA: hypothetical protein VIX17_05695 [Pyrinomonadaceae bacterium]|jgi:hypothetical protein